MEESRSFLDRLEAHCLQPQFRYEISMSHPYCSRQAGRKTHSLSCNGAPVATDLLGFARLSYDHAHTPGDVTLWHNYMTLHNSPPCMSNIESIDDARLMYRLSCKGEPMLHLPRMDDPDWLEEHIAGGYTSDTSIFQL